MFKTITALALALALLCGMAPTTALAADTGVTLVAVSDIYVLENTDGRVDPDRSVTYIAGETLYYEVCEVAAAPAPGAEPVRKPVAKPSDVKRNYELDYSNHGNAVPMSVALVSRSDASGDKRTYIAVRLRDNYRNFDTPRNLDVEITLTAKNGAKILEPGKGGYQAVDSYTIQLSEEVTYGELEDVGNGPLSVDDVAIYSFSGDADNVTLCFDANVEVTGNLRGARNKFLRLSVHDDDLEQAFPGAILRLFDGPESSRTFNRQVTVVIPVPAVEDANGKPIAPYLYEDRDGRLTAVSNAEYSMQDELFSIKTRVLGRYVISDEPLLAEPAETPAENPASSSSASSAREEAPPPVASQGAQQGGPQASRPAGSSSSSASESYRSSSAALGSEVSSEPEQDGEGTGAVGKGRPKMEKNRPA